MIRENFDHYVTQHFIKLFAAKDDGKAFVGNIKTKTFLEEDNFTRIMGERNWSVTQEVEDIFGQIEDSVAMALKSMGSNPKSIHGLAPTTKEGLINFIVMHGIRSTGLHDMVDQSATQLAEIIGSSDIQIGREDTLSIGLDMANEYATAIKARGCLAIVAADGDTFILGDNPFVRLSTQNEWYLKGGLPNPSTYFWIPLNAQLGLFFGKDLGTAFHQGKIKIVKASSSICSTLNNAESYLAKDCIVGSSKEVVGKGINADNAQNQRSNVALLSWAPIVVNQLNDVFSISEELVQEIIDLPQYT